MPEKQIVGQPLTVDISSLDQSLTPFYIVDGRGRILYFNQAMERLFGYTMDQCRGQVISMLAVEPEAAFRSVTEGLDSSAGNWQGDIEAQSRDGRTFPCQISATRLTNQKDGSALTLGMVTDLSDRKRTLDELKSRSDRLGALASLAARIGIYRSPARLASEGLSVIAELTPITQGFLLLVDEETGKLGLYSSFNLDVEVLEAFETDTGWERCTEGRAVRDKVPILVVETQADDQVRCPMKQFAESVAVIPLIIQDRTTGVLSVSTAPPDTLTENDMEFLVALASQIGIYLENARLTRNLEKRNRQLQSQYSDLKELLSIISHDLRSPLATIGGYASLLMKKGEEITEKERFQFSETIFRKTRETSKRFDDLLGFFRITLDTDKVSPEPVDTRRVVQQALEEAAPEKVRTQFEVVIDREMPVLMGYPAHLMHIFSNLLSNAIKFSMDQDNPRIAVTYRKTQHHDQTVHCFTVTDNGPGISPDYHHSIFKPFQRVPSADSIPGTGVGLAAVKRIVRLHGGSVSVESEPGKGSSFTFRLPWREIE